MEKGKVTANIEYKVGMRNSHLSKKALDPSLTFDPNFEIISINISYLFMQSLL